jgi:hypothetical protein
MGLTPGQIAGKAMRLNLQFHHGDQVQSISEGHPAAVSARTKFTTTVREPAWHDAVLKPGHHQRKLGGLVTKGAWKGFPIFSLTLEERATCPRSCMMWLRCYGNSMGMARRWQKGPMLERSIEDELGKLQRRYPRGFVVRLHILGDFYSLDYVRFWVRMGKSFPALRVFGYTAHEVSSPIGALIRATANANWDRFAIRTSGALRGLRTVVVDTYEDATRLGAIVCPAQSEKLAAAGKQISCGSCTLCWSSKRAVGFLLH